MVYLLLSRVLRVVCSHLVGYVLGQVAPTPARLHHIRQRRRLTLPDAERDVTTSSARISIEQYPPSRFEGVLRT